MSSTKNTRLSRPLSMKLLAAVALSAMLAVGVFATPASAQWDGHRHYHHGWTGGYYRPPPVIYGYDDGYYPPPLVYGPNIGFRMPGLIIGIH